VISGRAGILVLLTVTAAFLLAAILSPRFPQPAPYHRFAGQRGWPGIPNFAGVVSNFPFLIVGAWGCRYVLSGSGQKKFVDARERWPYALGFFGLLLTSLAPPTITWRRMRRGWSLTGCR